MPWPRAAVPEVADKARSLARRERLRPAVYARKVGQLPASTAYPYLDRL